MYGIIYLISNKINNKIYIGQTINFNKRMREYKNNFSKEQPKIHRAIDKYGWDNFDKLILDIAYSKEELDILECFYIEKFQSIAFGYNLMSGGSTSKHSEISIQKMRDAHKGEKNHHFGKRGILSFNYGRKMSSETKSKQKISKQYKMIKVICNETGEIFNCLMDAHKKLNIAVESISRNVARKRKSAGGYTFKKVI